MRPVSKTIRWAVGAFANSAAIAAAAVAALASRTTLPSRSITRICVSFIEMSKPAKYSMATLFLVSRTDPIGSPEICRPITPCCKRQLHGSLAQRSFGRGQRFKSSFSRGCCRRINVVCRVARKTLQQYLPGTDIHAASPPRPPGSRKYTRRISTGEQASIASGAPLRDRKYVNSHRLSQIVKLYKLQTPMLCWVGAIWLGMLILLPCRWHWLRVQSHTISHR